MRVASAVVWPCFATFVTRSGAVCMSAAADQVGDVTFFPPQKGPHTTVVLASMWSGTPGATIWYTTDGSKPVSRLALAALGAAPLPF